MWRRRFLPVSLALLLWTTLLGLSTLPLGLCKKEDDIKCSHNAVAMAMTTCQGERHKLSLASQANDTVKLCSALQQYSVCMTPRIEGCKGPAKMAFDVITGKYASQPYNCKIALEDPNGLQGGMGDNSYQEGMPADSLGDHPFHHHHTEDNSLLSERDEKMGATDTKETTGSQSRHPPTQPDDTRFVNQSSETSDGAETVTGSQTDVTSTAKPDNGEIGTTSLSDTEPPSEFDRPSGESGARCSHQHSLTMDFLLLLTISISLYPLISV